MCIKSIYISIINKLCVLKVLVLVLGTWYLVLGTCTWYLVLVLGTWYLVLGTWPQAKPQNALPSSLILSGALHETHGSQKKNSSQTKHFYWIC